MHRNYVRVLVIWVGTLIAVYAFQVAFS